MRVGGSAGGHVTSFTVEPQAVDPASDHEFPAKDPTPSQLDVRIKALEAKMATLQPSQGGVTVTPNNGSQPATKGAPGFEPLLALVGALGVALALRRR